MKEYIFVKERFFEIIATVATSLAQRALNKMHPPDA